jgi:lipopolysaccharide assembly outer membrane protein LptD (OstA)
MPKHDPKWSVRWQRLDVNATGMNISSGKMYGVTGLTFSNLKPELRFSADSGTGDKQDRVLDLQGNVKVTSIAKAETMLADEVLYDAGTHVLTAKGNVRFEGSVGTVGTFSELLASSDFKRIGTPGAFSTP